VLDSGLAKMHVHVDEAGRNHEARCVKHLGAGEIEARAHAGDPAIFNRKVGYRIESGRRIEDAAIFN
jgi:hypothetical protein